MYDCITAVVYAALWNFLEVLSREYCESSGYEDLILLLLPNFISFAVIVSFACVVVEGVNWDQWCNYMNCVCIFGYI